MILSELQRQMLTIQHNGKIFFVFFFVADVVCGLQKKKVAYSFVGRLVGRLDATSYLTRSYLIRVVIVFIQRNIN